MLLNRIFAGLFLLVLAHNCFPQQDVLKQNAVLSNASFQTITLETSLKPFRKNDRAYIRNVVAEMFGQWSSILRHADTVAIMLWTADGSEILDYRGKGHQTLEWAKYLGNPNTSHAVGAGPKELSLHERAYLYMDNPPVYTYNDLAFIVRTFRETGKKITGKTIRVGATFDPGPEFAKSDFKYRKHPEILAGNAMGAKSFVSCYSVLKADEEKYAGFPHGIPANTPFGTFFGRQAQKFLTNIGFDFLWLSNGFGFGMEAWSSTGAIFTGKGFNENKLPDIREKILEFWKLFRKECPSFPIQTRGTNLSTGTDLARDGVDLKAIYEGGFNLLPPPNSPWAALDGDFGMELVGYMSRIATLPDNRFLFRYYVHDPWWVNSPWFDRYGHEPHDIYLPMSVSRIDSAGKIGLPTQLNFLSIDNSFGQLPKQVPDEVIPHVLKARYDAPTAAGPFVWVYPLDEYHQWAYAEKGRLPEIYFGDWFIRQAINNSFPLNTIISTSDFTSLQRTKPGYFDQSVLVTVVPGAQSTLEKALIEFVRNGGKLIVYGPADHAGLDFLALLNLDNVKGLSGEFELVSYLPGDSLLQPLPVKILHDTVFSGGAVRTQIHNRTDSCTTPLAIFQQGAQSRDVAWARSLTDWKGGQVVYLRGTNSSSFKGGKLLTPDNPERLFTGPLLLRYVLQRFGYSINIEKDNPAQKNPVLTIARSDNGFFFSGFMPDMTVKQYLKFPQGAPILTGYETRLHKGAAGYSLPTAWHRECRVFIEQEDGIVSCKEIYSGDKDITRRIKISGLKNAIARIYPGEHVPAEKFHAYRNAAYPWKTGKQDFAKGDPKYGDYFEIKNITGELVVAW
jgi:hypothetical protein